MGAEYRIEYWQEVVRKTYICAGSSAALNVEVALEDFVKVRQSERGAGALLYYRGESRSSQQHRARARVIGLR